MYKMKGNINTDLSKRIYDFIQTISLIMAVAIAIIYIFL